MKIPSAMLRLKGYRHPREIIAYAGAMPEFDAMDVSSFFGVSKHHQLGIF